VSSVQCSCQVIFWGDLFSPFCLWQRPLAPVWTFPPPFPPFPIVLLVPQRCGLNNNVVFLIFPRPFIPTIVSLRTFSCTSFLSQLFSERRCFHQLRCQFECSAQLDFALFSLLSLFPQGLSSCHFPSSSMSFWNLFWYRPLYKSSGILIDVFSASLWRVFCSGYHTLCFAARALASAIEEDLRPWDSFYPSPALITVASPSLHQTFSRILSGINVSSWQDIFSCRFSASSPIRPFLNSSAFSLQLLQNHLRVCIDVDRQRTEGFPWQRPPSSSVSVSWSTSRATSTLFVHAPSPTAYRDLR